MSKLILFLAFTLLTYDSNSQSEGIKQETEIDLNNLFEQRILDQNIVGASAGYSIYGVTEWQAAIGFSDKKNNITFETETKVRMASIAKSMTAIAVMQLVEKGLINLDSPIKTYIPDYPLQSKIQITTRHLLSHTSGIAGYKNSKEAETKITYSSLTDAVDLFKNRKLLFEPGTKYNYTSYGYTLLGLIIEKVSGINFESYMRENIWDVAGMMNTGVDKYNFQEENSSKFYRRTRKGKIKSGVENNLSNRVPGGGFYTTVLDMLKFGNAVIENDLIKQETLSLMREHHSLEKESNAYGFGWFLYNPKPNEGAIIGHSGGQTGCSSQLFIIPEKGIVTIVLANTSRAPEASMFAVELMKIAIDKR